MSKLPTEQELERERIELTEKLQKAAAAHRTLIAAVADAAARSTRGQDGHRFQELRSQDEANRLEMKGLRAAIQAVEREIEDVRQAKHEAEIEAHKRELAGLYKKAEKEAEILEVAMRAFDLALSDAQATWNKGRVVVQKLAEVSNPDGNYHRTMIGNLAALKGLWRDPSEAVEMRRRVLSGRVDGLLPGYRPASMKAAFFDNVEGAAEEVIKRA